MIEDLKDRLLMELLKDSKKRDRELAKKLGVSQPTVTRIRNKLVREGFIQEFTIIPDWAKLGYAIMAITIAKAKSNLAPDEQAKATKLVLENPNILFVASANGMGKNGVMISLHKNYSDFSAFIKKLTRESGGYLEDLETMLVSLTNKSVVKPFSLAYLAENAQ